MSRSPEQPSVDITVVPRAVLAAAAGVVHSVERAVGGTTRTAKGNAWEAVLADRRRANLRAEVNELVATRARAASRG